MSKILDFVSNFVHSDEEMSQKKEVRKMKKFLGLLLVFGMMSGIAHASSSTESFKCTVTPIGSYLVTVATEGFSRDFGAVALSGNATIRIGTTTNQGTFACELDMLASDASDGTNSWELAGSAAANQYALQLDVDTDGTAAPGFSTFCDDVAKAEIPTTGTIAAGASKFLWAKLTMPSTSIGTGQYTLTVSIYAATPD
ncbi:MAG: hypothetical protein Q7K21_03670 [Elusimicrobiota bacterium]|nr:hypothetical protein [Elusimicrobiota bacterium]